MDASQIQRPAGPAERRQALGVETPQGRQLFLPVLLLLVAVSGGPIALLGLQQMLAPNLEPWMANVLTAVFGGLLVGLAGWLVWKRYASQLNQAVEQIADLQRHAAATQEGVEQFRKATSAIADAVVFLDAENRITYWNDTAARMFGYTSTEALDKHLHLLLAPVRQRGAWQNALEQFLLSGATQCPAVELLAARKDGSEFPLELSYAQVRTAGQWSGVGTLRDISRHKHAEETLQEAHAQLEKWSETTTSELAKVNQQLQVEVAARKQLERERARLLRDLQEGELSSRAVLEAATESVALVDRAGVVLSLNETAARRLGKSAAEIVGLVIFDFLPTAVARSRQANLEKAVALGKAFCFEDQLLGTWYEHVYCPVLDTANQVVRVAMFSSDITAAKRLERERDRLQRELEENERKTQAILDATTESVFFLDPAGIVLGLNETAAKRLGRPAGEILGHSLWDFLPAEVAQERKAHLAKAVSLGKPLCFEDQCRGWWYEHVLCPVLDSGDKVVRLAMFSCDITVRRRLEMERDRLTREVHEGELRARTILEAATEAVLILDPAGIVLASNEIAARRLGRSLEKLLGHALFDFFPPELSRTRRAWFDKAVAGGKPVTFEDQRQGQWFEHVFCPVADGEGKVARIALFSRDITEEKRTEAALRAGEERFRSLVENASDWIWEMDQQGVYTYASPRVKDLLGYAPEEVMGRKPLDFLAPEENERIGHELAEILEVPKPFSRLEKSCLHKGGQRVVLEASGVPVFDESNRLVGYRGIDRDVTARKTAEIERERLLKEMQEALAKVKTLSGLLPICAACKKIRDDKGGWESVESYIQKHSNAQFSHCICPDCIKKLYPEVVQKR